MDVSRRRAGVKAAVVAGSVWESRMKLDEVKGGIKVFNGEDNNGEQTAAPAAAGGGGGGGEGGGDVSPVTPVSSRKAVRKGPTAGTTSSVGVSGKRKTWKSEGFDGPIQIARGRTEPATSKNSEEQCRELSVSTGGLIKKSPVQVKKGRSESVDGIVKSPIQTKKGRSETMKDIGVGAPSIDGNEKSPSQARKPRSEVKEVVESGANLRKVKSDAAEVKGEPDKDVEKDSVHLRKVKSEPDKVVEGVANEIEKSPPEAEENGSEDNCKEFGVCQEKVISSTETSQTAENHDNDDDVIEDDEGEEEELEGDEEEEEVDEEIEVEKKSVDIKEIKVTEEKPKGIETSCKIAEQKPVKKVEIRVPEQKPVRKVVNEERKVHQFSNRAAPTSPIVNKQPPPVMRRAAIYQNLTKQAQIPVANANNQHKFQPTTHSHSKLQNLVDLVMWRDISRTALAFGIGSFIIISSSYTKDINVSFISVMSYLGLVYLATIFLYRSLICRGLIVIDDNSSYVLGEDEAIWLMKLVLPYLNECLLKIRALFSGDPSTTMKMAVLLFVLARCGSSITIWKMAKLGFFGVFTVPKVCSLYSTQITAYAKFWIRRFRDAWDSCTHKKAVALGIFTLVWNLSSMVARIWAIFMMYVAVRYYQQTMEREDWVVEEEEEGAGGAAEEEKWSSSSGGGQIHQKGATATATATTNSFEVNKAKKKY